MMRVMLIRDMNDDNGVTPTAASILATPSAPVNIISPLNKDNTSKYKVIYDHVYKLTSTQQPIVEIQKYFYFPMDKDIHGNNTVGQHLKWDSGDGLENGHIYMMLISDQKHQHPIGRLVQENQFYR